MRPIFALAICVAVAFPVAASVFAPLPTERLATGESPICWADDYWVVADADDWYGIWDCIVGGIPPAVDFSHDVVLYASEDHRPRDCPFAIVGAEGAADAVTRVVIRGASPSDACTSDIGVTYDFVKVSRPMGLFVFVDEATGEIVYVSA